MKNKRRICMAVVAWGTVPKKAGRKKQVRSAGFVQQTALIGLMLLTACGCAVALPGAATRGRILPTGVNDSHAAPDDEGAADKNRPEEATLEGPQLAAEEPPSLPPLPVPSMVQPATTSPAAVQRMSETNSAIRQPSTTQQRSDPGSPLHEPDHRGHGAPTDVRIATLEEQVQWLRGDIARLQQLLNNLTAGESAATGLSGHSAHHQQSLQQHVEELRAGLDGTSRSDRDQQATIDALNRRIATLETAFVNQQTSEVRALDDVIAGMEQLLQLQAKQAIRTSHAGREKHDTKR